MHDSAYSGIDNTKPTIKINGVVMVNIRGTVENIKQYPPKSLKPMTKKQQQSMLQNIRTRYLEGMKKQLINSSKTTSAEKFLNSLDLAKMEELEGVLEENFVQQFNSVTQSEEFLNGVTKGLDGIRDTYSSINNNRNKAIQTVKKINDFLDFMTQHATELGLGEAIIKKQQGLRTSIADIFGLTNMLQRLNRFINDAASNSEATIRGWVPDDITKPSEGVVGYVGLIIGLQTRSLIENELEGALENSLVGTKGQGPYYITYVNPRTGKTVTIPSQPKNVDVKTIGGQFFNVEAALNGFTYSTGITYSPLISAKFYKEGNESFTKVSSGSGINSPLIRLLHLEYGSSNAINYTIYNTLAFSKNSGAGLESNFRIMRETVNLYLMERLIAGFNPETMTGIMVVRNRAYSTLSILNAIIAQEMNNRPSQWGSQTTQGKYFYVYFPSGLNNHWEGDKNLPSFSAKAARISTVMKAAEGLKVEGKINNALFKELQNPKSVPMTEGIQIFT